jgi:hypothetical protein
MIEAPASSSQLRAKSPAMVFRPRSGPPELFRLLLAQWFYAAVACRHELGRTTAPGDQLRSELSALIAFGEWAQTEAQNSAVDLSPIGVTRGDVKAETRLLRDTYRSAFDNCLSGMEAETILKEVFG